MTRQTLAVLIAPLLLTGCATFDFQEADPSLYAGYECEELDLLAESYRETVPTELFADVSELERSNAGNRNLSLRDDARPYEIEQDRRRRSLALARREKGC